ncbi:MAG: hypothetical protein WCP29_05660 [Acidobacteriota bacterium]
MASPRARIFFWTLLAAVIASGCGERRAARSSSIHLATRSELTTAEVKYGVAPTPGPSVIYQPEVIIVGGGAEIIRSQGDNGFTWTIDGNAPHAGELAAGKIMFVTGRAVGRVIEIHRDGGNLVATLGPVDITELIHDAHLTFDQPVDFGEAIAYVTPELPGAITPVSPLMAAAWPGAGPGGVRTVALTTESTAFGQADPASPDVTKLVNFKVVPFANSSGVGLRAKSDKGGLLLTAEASIHLATPQLHVNLQIANGKVQEANLELTGAAGLTMRFDAGTDVGRSANVNGRFVPNTDFSIPIIGLGFPFAVTARQQFIIKTGFGVRNTTLSAVGDYTFGGSFKVGYSGKTWGLFGPTSFSAKQSLAQSMGGVSLGASGLNMDHQLKVIVGVGAAGFATGPYFAFNTGVGVSRGSDAGMLRCQGAELNVALIGGVGYFIPKAVTDAINFVLRALNVKYRVLGEGGFSSDPLTIVHSAATDKGCGTVR